MLENIDQWILLNVRPWGDSSTALNFSFILKDRINPQQVHMNNFFKTNKHDRSRAFCFVCRSFKNHSQCCWCLFWFLIKLPAGKKNISMSVRPRPEEKCSFFQQSAVSSLHYQVCINKTDTQEQFYDSHSRNFSQSLFTFPSVASLLILPLHRG